MNNRKKFLGLLFWLATAYLTAFFASQFELGEWYRQLQKPWFTPPDLAFPVVWSILYTLMGISVWLVWKERREAKRLAIGLYVIQLIFNGVWSYLFFELHWLGTALVDISLLWLVIGGMIRNYWAINRYASLVLIPYLGWISLAWALNVSIYLNNA